MLKLSHLFAIAVLTVPLLPSLAEAQESNPPGSSTPPASSSPVASPAANESPYFRSRAKNLARQAAERANGGLRQYRAESAMSGPALTAPYVENADGSLTFTFKGGPPGGTLTTETVATVSSSGAVNLDYNGPIRGSNVGGAQLPPATQAAPAAPPTNSGWTPPAAPAPAMPTPAAPAPVTPAPAVPAPAAPPSQKGLPKLTPQSSRPQPVTIRPDAQALPTPSEPITVASAPNQPVATAPLTIQPTERDPGLSADLFLARAKNIARQAAIRTNGGLAQYRPEPRMFGPASQAPHTKNADGSITFKFRGGAPGVQTQALESEITVAQDSTVTINYNGPVRQ